MRLRPGSATAEGTRRLAERSMERRRIPAAHFRTTPDGITVSSLGLGTYIGAPDAPTDLAVEQATRISLESLRVNVLDTALNYRHQRAERSLGRGLLRLLSAGTLAREEVFVATKNGYLAPDAESPLSPTEWVQEELIRPGVLKRADIVDGSHAMSVSFLSDQLERSRRNLGLECIDLLYLHNAADAQLATVGRGEFLDRLSGAFRLYESARREGRIVTYGLATWDCLRLPPNDPGFLDLQTVLRLAREAGGEGHGFRYVQFPFSFALPEAARYRNQPVGRERLTLFEAIHRLGLACFTSVPLHQGQLSRSAPASDGLTRAQSAIQFARSAPGNLAPLIGQKRPEHLSENLRLAEIPPWSREEFQGQLSSPDAAP